MADVKNPPLEARHISVSIERSPAQVYAFARSRENLARWASGLSSDMDVRFAPPNSFGVLDHEVVFQGKTFQNPMRVVPNEGGSELTFTLLRRPEMSDEDFERDTATLRADFATLKRLLEAEPASARAESSVHVHHGIDYIELTVSDVASAMRFYAAAFGWRFNQYGPNYAGIQGEGREVGGLSGQGTVTPGSTLVVLYSENLEATRDAVVAAGGRVVKEPYGFPGGRRFHFADPSGNELAVWSPA